MSKWHEITDLSQVDVDWDAEMIDIKFGSNDFGGEYVNTPIALIDQAKWIPCTETTPSDEFKVVLCYAPEFRYEIIVGVYRDGYWRRPGPAFSTLLPVTHWMPLPNTPG